MRFAERTAFVSALLLALSASADTASLSMVHRQRYAMGTMFDIIVHHPSRASAEDAVEKALDEVVRLDALMSHFNPESELSRLNRQASDRAVPVDASVFDILERSVAMSRRSGGRFDVTIAPLLKVWKRQAEDGRVPSATAIATARECVGSQYLELSPPNFVRFRSPCLELDLGGIGKGYAVDTAMAVLRAAGIQHATINAGGSSIAAIGTPPGRNGWPVRIGGVRRAGRALLLRDSSISTSQQDPSDVSRSIVDARNGARPEPSLTVSVVTPDATLADALSTTLLMMSVQDGKNLLGGFDDVSALWVTASGELNASYGAARLEVVDGTN